MYRFASFNGDAGDISIALGIEIHGIDSLADVSFIDIVFLGIILGLVQGAKEQIAVLGGYLALGACQDVLLGEDREQLVAIVRTDEDAVVLCQVLQDLVIVVRAALDRRRAASVEADGALLSAEAGGVLDGQGSVVGQSARRWHAR